MGRREVEFPPLYFADALVRAGLDVSGLVLEINLGCSPGCTLPRTPLEFSRHLDHWSLLGLPLYLCSACPARDGADPLARIASRCRPGSGPARVSRPGLPATCRLILAKPGVQGVFWNQLRDAAPHDFPHGGLFDEHGHAQACPADARAIRQTLLR